MPLSGHGGIGRRDGFRIRWATVQVQVLLPAEKSPVIRRGSFFRRCDVGPVGFPYPELLEAYVSLCRRAFGENLCGVYLHGSAVMGCFHPTGSDVDLLAVTEREPSDGEKRVFLDSLLPLSGGTPCQGIETSVVLLKDCLRPRHPIPFVFHYSESHRERAERDPEGFIRSMRGEDRDLAAHFAVTRARGMALYGDPPREVFGEISREDYADAILYDVERAPEEIGEHPVYLTLNLCRGLAFLREGLVLSKAEGGAWGLSHLSEAYLPLIRAGLEAYRSGESMADTADGENFARYMLRALGDERKTESNREDIPDGG